MSTSNCTTIFHTHATLTLTPQDAIRIRLQKIRHLSQNAIPLPQTSLILAFWCADAYIAVQQAPPDRDEDQHVHDILGRALNLLNRLSSSFYVWHSGPELLFNQVMAVRDELLGAISTQRVLQASQLTTQQLSEQSVVESCMQSLTGPKENVIKAELRKWNDKLERLQRGRKAHKIFSKGVICITEKILAKWHTDTKIDVVHGTEQNVRFGTLSFAHMGGELVLVKRVDEIHGTSKDDTTKRCMALVHWMKYCEGLMPVQHIQRDWIIFGAVNATPLDVYLTRGALSHNEMWVLAFKVASALCYVHKCEIIHRAVRASSIFMVETAPGTHEPKLGGFEICRSDDIPTLSIGPKDIHEVWDAPERRQNHGSSHKTDVFAFGVLLFEIAMGRPPLWAENTNKSLSIIDQIKHNVYEWLAEVDRYVPSRTYWSLMQRCLHTNDLDRPSMSVVFDELTTEL